MLTAATNPFEKLRGPSTNVTENESHDVANAVANLFRSTEGLSRLYEGMHRELVRGFYGIVCSSKRN